MSELGGQPPQARGHLFDVDADPRPGGARGGRAGESPLVGEGTVPNDTGGRLRREDEPRPPARVLEDGALARRSDPALLHHHELEADARAEPLPATQRMPELGVLGRFERGEVLRGHRFQISETGEIEQTHLDMVCAELDPDQLERVRH